MDSTNSTSEDAHHFCTRIFHFMDFDVSKCNERPLTNHMDELHGENNIEKETHVEMSLFLSEKMSVGLVPRVQLISNMDSESLIYRTLEPDSNAALSPHDRTPHQTRYE